MSNYRPIAITSSLSKVYEKIFLYRLEHHLQINNCLNSQQHGFQKGKSTITALYDFVENVSKSIEAKEKLNVILYDFSNAFGTMFPPRLIQKLKVFGYNDKALSLMQSFLQDREQYVQMREIDCDNTEIYINSKKMISNMGVPQGTILGPNSFTSYINDISLTILIALLILFADDTTALVKGKTYEEVNTKTLASNRQMVEFASSNFLHINANKTKILQMHTHQTRTLVPPEVHINEREVEVVHDSKLLGVIISDTMNWSEQCDKVANKLRSITYMFTMLRERVTESILKQVYFAYAQSQVLYSIIIWGGAPQMNRVFVAQKRVVRAMAGRRYWRSNCALDSCRPLFHKFGIMTVYSLYILESMKYLKRHPEKFTKCIDVPFEIRKQFVQTRSQKANNCENDLYYNNCRLNLSIQNPDIMIPRIFNALPVYVKMISDDKNFLCKIREITLKRQFYDMDEYFVCNFESV